LLYRYNFFHRPSKEEVAATDLTASAAITDFDEWENHAGCDVEAA
jgi:hypothetical protein